MTFRNRMLLAGLSFVVIAGLLYSFIYTMEKSIEDNMNHIVYDRYLKVRVADQVINEANSLLNHVIFAAYDENKQLDLDTVVTLNAQIKAYFNELRALTNLPQGRALLAQTEERFALYDQGLKDLIVEMQSSETLQMHYSSIVELQQYRTAFQDSLFAYIDFQELVMQESTDEAVQNVRAARTNVMAALIVMVLLTLGIGWHTMRGVSVSIRKIAAVMDSYNADDHSALPRIEMDSKDEIATIAHAYNRMADDLEQKVQAEAGYLQSLEDENWIKDHISRISVMSQSAVDLSMFSDKLLTQLAPAIQAACAAFYIIDRTSEENRYTCKAAYAWEPRAADQPSYLLGEGLVGQCAASGTIMELEVPDTYMNIQTGLGASRPNQLMLLPVFHNNEVIAVLELGLFLPVSGLTRKLLDQAITTNLGMIIRNLQYRRHVEKLYAESQTYNEELQVQSEELVQQQEELRALNEKLEEQAKVAESNSQYKSEFLANMSHELRTPLNSLLVLAQILKENREGNLNTKQLQYVETMVLSGNHLLNLINDILDLSKVEAGQMTSTPTPNKLAELIEELNLQFRPQMDKKQLAFHLKLDPRLQHTLLVTDRQRLMQILQNLLSNALKFTETGHVELKVGLKEQPGSDQIYFEVSDTGIGIAFEHQHQIFEAFKQIESTTARRYGGTGLGLAISQEMASVIGGTLTVRSEAGAGSSFTLFLPFLTTGQESFTQAAPALEPSYHPHDELLAAEGAKVLIVDDDLRNIYSLSSALEDSGYTVYCAENGQEALDLLQDRKVDLVLMDIMMPGMDGYETIRSIRSSSSGISEVPIIALTANAMREDRDRCIEAGADDYISKPVRLDKLKSLIQVWLQGTKSH